MKLKVLVDNNTYIDNYYYGEPAVSYYIENEDKKILFDVGYSDVFIKNAIAFQINLNDITDIVISHGHDDHVRGLKYLFERFDMADVRVVAHPNAFNEKRIDSLQIGSPFTREQMRERCSLALSKKPLKICDNLFFLGEIPSLNNFEPRNPIGKEKTKDIFVEDFLLDDTALAYKSEKGIYIITGCSHSGICNIIEYSKSVCNESRVAGVLGGFHLFDINQRLEKTIDYLKKNNIHELYPCHCVSFYAKAEIHKSIPIHEVGVAMELYW